MAPAWMLALVLGATPAPPDVAVVCPDAMREALAPWLAARARQGHRLRLLAAGRPAEAITRDLRKLAAAGGLRYVVLVGDAPGGLPPYDIPPAAVPTHFVPARVNVRWGSEPEIASDNPYADLDGDGRPDVAVGRLTADTPGELATIVEKILAYERSRDFGTWRRQVRLVAGVGGFGRIADAVVEAGARRLIADALPASLAVSMSYASWRSPYCPDPRSFSAITQSGLNEGCLFWVYMGHGQRRTLDRLRTPRGEFPILETEDVPRLDCRSGQPVACLLACYTAAFDGEEDCLAEELLRAPGGPVAVIGGTRVTMPYGNAVLATSLLGGYGAAGAERGGSEPTLGDLLLRAKRGMAAEGRTVADRATQETRATLDLLASAMGSAGPTRAAERREHVALYQLLGDPLLRLPQPVPVRLDVSGEKRGGGMLRIAGQTPLAGTMTVELVARRDRLTFRPRTRRAEDAVEPTWREWHADYVKANDPRWASIERQVQPGAFLHELTVPRRARGPCHVRVFVEGSAGCAAGASEVTLHPVEATTTNPRPPRNAARKARTAR